MEEFRNAFEQYCPRLGKNVVVEVRFARGGGRVLKCAGADGCEENCPYMTRLNRCHFTNYPRK